MSHEILALRDHDYCKILIGDKWLPPADEFTPIELQSESPFPCTSSNSIIPVSSTPVSSVSDVSQLQNPQTITSIAYERPLLISAPSLAGSVIARVPICTARRPQTLIVGPAIRVSAPTPTIRPALNGSQRARLPFISPVATIAPISKPIGVFFWDIFYFAVLCLKYS